VGSTMRLRLQHSSPARIVHKVKLPDDRSNN
jgi:hypothetical protein